MNTPDKHDGLPYLGVIAVCPLLARATTLLTGIAMGIAALSILFITVVSVSACRRYIPYGLRLPIILVIGATWVTVLDLTLQACWFEMHEALGIYIPLLALNSLILLSLEQTALTTSPGPALKAMLSRGMAILGSVSLVGALRELLGQGGFLTDADVMLGKDYLSWLLVDGAYNLFNFAPGALFMLGLLLAAYRQIESRLPRQAAG